MLSIYRLPNQLPDEKIILIIRKDFFILFKKVLLLAILAVLPLLFFGLILLPNASMMQWAGTGSLIVLGVSAYYLFLWLFFFFSFLDYYLDVWIVTSERIIDIDQKGFFSRTISENKIFQVQDVTSEVQGFFPTILKYGNVFVQTAGEVERFFFSEVPEPDKIRDMIIKLVQDKRDKGGGLLEKG